MLVYVRKFWWHFVLLGLAVYIAVLYSGHTKKRNSSNTNVEGRKTKDIKNFILKKGRRPVKKYCEKSSDSCFTIEDRPAVENDRLITKRYLLFKDTEEFSITVVELHTPQELTWKNFDSRQWSINKLVVHSVYAKLMIAMGFVMEALDFNPAEWQNMLMIGLGGGTMSNFLSAVDSVMANLTIVELNPTILDMATDWFGLQESRTNKVFVEDGTEFLRGAAQREEKYKLILLDACHNDKQPIICPVKEFLKSAVIQDIVNVLDDDGVLTVNILSSRDHMANEDDILSSFKEHFTTCFLLRYNSLQRLLVCTKREGWSFEQQRSRFMQNFQNVDDRFHFGLTDVITREN